MDCLGLPRPRAGEPAVTNHKSMLQAGTTDPGRSPRIGVTSDEAEDAPRLRVTYGEDSKGSKTVTSTARSNGRWKTEDPPGYVLRGRDAAAVVERCRLSANCWRGRRRGDQLATLLRHGPNRIVHAAPRRCRPARHIVPGGAWPFLPSGDGCRGAAFRPRPAPGRPLLPLWSPAEWGP
jgi:hypothetical protein